MAEEEAVPQSNVLSVTCFALAINTLPDYVARGVGTSLYVGNFAMLTSSKNLPSAEQRLQRSMNIITKFSHKNGLA